MTLQEAIAYYKIKNQNGIIAYEQTNHSKIELSQVIEEALKGNCHLSMVFSEDKGVTEKDFVLAALNALEFDLYDISEELSNYEIRSYSYNNFINEIWFPITKEILTVNSIVEEDCNLIFKLKDKDELTFLIQTKTQYIFIKEIYWMS